MNIKRLSLIALFLSVISLGAIAQIGESNLFVNVSESNVTPAASIEARSDDLLFAQHTAQIQENIREHLLLNLSYSQLLYDQGVSGRVELVLEIDPDGQISSLHVRRGLSELSDKLAIEALEKIELLKAPYFGASTIVIPVDFSLN